MSVEGAGRDGGVGRDLRPHDPAIGVLVRDWLRAVAPTTHLPAAGNGTDLTATLRTLAVRVVTALTAPDPDPDAGLSVGADLVAAHLTSAEALRGTVRVLSAVPASLAETRNPALDGRIGPLLAAVAAGFTAALQDRALLDQELIRVATLTARDDAEQARRDSEARLRAVFDAAGVAIAVADLTGRLVEANPALAAMFGVPVTDLPGRTLYEFIHIEDVPAVQEQVHRQLANGGADRVRLEKRFLRADGRVGWTMLTVSLVRDADERPAYLVAMGEDVTERHQLADRLHHQAHHDPLTGLPNRVLLQQRLGEVFTGRHPYRLGVCFLDLDQFKAINDTLGHDVGDRLLVKVAERLRRCVSESGHFIARVGGDEFVVLVSGSDGPDAVTALAERMLAAVATPVDVDGHDLRVSASIGVVEQGIDTGDPAQILRDADATMYWAKADGRGRWALFDEDRNAAQLMRYGLAADLPGAIEGGQFDVEYQPLVSLRDGRLHGAEALVRWRHPRLGTVAPNTFVPLAEQSGLIVPLGRHVLREACRRAAMWSRAQGDPLPFVSVNVSPRQCTEPGLVDDVLKALHDAGLQPANLQLELTETDVMGSLDQIVTTLQELADLGVRIAIDDFGIGYSNLAHLRHLPVHGLKLAGAFMSGIRAAATDPLDEQLVETVIKLAHAFGMSVTAEGIETADQAARLALLGCDLGQGWHFGRPGPPESIGDRDNLPTFDPAGL